jgi:hypothetical protein
MENGSPLLRLEGFMGVGKSSVAHLIAADATVPVRVIGSDDFAAKGEPRTYREAVDLPALRAAAQESLENGGKVIFEGVCLEELLPSQEFGRGFVVYLQRVSVPVPQTPLWHDIYDLDREAPDDPLHASIIQYHREHRPHDHCDLALAIPEGRD